MRLPQTNIPALTAAYLELADARSGNCGTKVGPWLISPIWGSWMPKKPRRPQPVKVTRPNAETGELEVEIKPASAFPRLSEEKPPEDGGDPHLLHKRSQYGYTDSPFNAMAGDAGEAVPPAFQKQLTTEAHNKRAEEREAEQAREQARSAMGQIRRLQDQARKQGKDPNLVLLRTVKDLEDLAA